jgi:hypothetical protein
MYRCGTIENDCSGTRFTDTAGHRFGLDELIGRDDETGNYDSSVVRSLDGADPAPGTSVVIEDGEDAAEIDRAAHCGRPQGKITMVKIPIRIPIPPRLESEKRGVDKIEAVVERDGIDILFLTRSQLDSLVAACLAIEETLARPEAESVDGSK